MENEKKTNKRKRKIFAIVTSMCLCLLLMGVAVYAATVQSASITNTIEIRTSNQVRTDVNIYGVIGADGVTYANNGENPTVEPTWGTALLSKGYTEDDKTGNGLAPVFQYGQEYYCAYCFDIDNTASANVSVDIAFNNQDVTPSEYTFNDQLTVYTGSVWGSLTELTGDTDRRPSVTNVSVDASATMSYYVVIAIKGNPEDLTAVASEGFNIVVTVNQRTV